MRHGTSSRRQRGRGNGGSNGGSRRNGNGSRTQVYDSNGPDVRIRGTAHQVAEKYTTLARDATSMGNIILAESYLQHVEHYQRIINAQNENVQAIQAQTQAQTQVSKEAVSQKKTTVEKQVKNDDLSLPSSILGDAPKVASAEGTMARTGALSDA